MSIIFKAMGESKVNNFGISTFGTDKIKKNWEF
jgi:hypothetical protein